ncbi:MAG: hypothetical protein DMG43_13315 [Acidobacteria bacterium]|nr:MAG: hypothetical protein DMG43_13315 [Acidobacteriota bacterium]
MLVGSSEAESLRKIQVKTKRTPPWYVKQASFKGKSLNQVTVYVLIGPENGNKPVRFFIAENRLLAKHVHRPSRWKKNALMPVKAVEKYEGRWDALLK